MQRSDAIRELGKIEDVLKRANKHFQFESAMNAELHMSDEVRPAPLATAVNIVTTDIQRLREMIEVEGVT